ncbi:MAG: glycosyltransferase family 4 protein [Rhodanobacteraceae bacterium]|jgi:glycosyltransferase involved in cell wall biosynthesis|nr:glycosyltransferase family 4 protein [Rhodanobacteraceae bacterium]
MAEPLRVLVVSDEMEVGGSQRQIAGLLRALPRAQCHAELAYFRSPSFLVDEIERAGIRVHRIDKRRRIDLGFLLRLARFLRRGRFDVVHCFSFTAELWTRLALLVAPGAALVASMRGLGCQLSPLQWRIKRLVCASACAVISNSQRAGELIRVAVGARVPVHVIANGVEPPPPLSARARAALRAEIGAGDARVLALFVGRLSPEKNVGMLLDTLAAMPPGRRPRLALAGDGAERAALERHAQQLGLGQDVRFLGERRDAPMLMQAADLLVLPSSDEGLSNVVLEAMAAGCPAVVTRVGGNTELIEDGVSGLLVEPGDAAALRLALERLSGDAALRRQLGAAGRTRVADHYSPAALARDTLRVYRTCVATR